MTAPCRRWSFSLRTLVVVVTVLACWFGYQLNWIRQRQLLLEDPHFVASAARVAAPWPLRLFGETGPSWLAYEQLTTDEFVAQDQDVIYSTEVLDTTLVKEQLDRAARLFPESGIIEPDLSPYIPCVVPPATQAAPAGPVPPEADRGMSVLDLPAFEGFRHRD